MTRMLRLAIERNFSRLFNGFNKYLVVIKTNGPEKIKSIADFRLAHGCWLKSELIMLNMQTSRTHFISPGISFFLIQFGASMRITIPDGKMHANRRENCPNKDGQS